MSPTPDPDPETQPLRRTETREEVKDRRKAALGGLAAIALGLGLGVWAYVDWIRSDPNGETHLAPLFAPALLVIFGVYNVMVSRRSRTA